MVNVGGWAGPLMAIQLRQLSWDNLFFACAAIISINFILLLIYKEPGKEERLAHKAKVDAGEIEQEPLANDSPLWRMPNVIVSPHMSGDFVGYSTVLVELFLENFELFCQGKPLLNMVNKRLGYVERTTS